MVISHPIVFGFISNLFDSPQDWIIILVIAVLLFGKRLPEIGRSVGRTIVEFKKGLNQSTDEINRAAHEDDAPPAKPLVTTQTSLRQIKPVASATDEP